MNVLAPHSETLMGEMDHMFKRTGLDPMELDVIAVSSGPGAFTGLRVGLGTAKGLAFSTGARIVSVPTLQAFAFGLSGSASPVAPMLDARKKEVYTGLFLASAGGDVSTLIPERAVRAAEFAAELGEHERVVFAGLGAELYKEEIIEACPAEAIFAPAAAAYPSPASVAYRGLRMALRGEFTDPASASPRYLRKSEAEVAREKGKTG